MDYQLDKSTSIIKWIGYQQSGQHFGTVQFKQGKIRMTEGLIIGGYVQVDLATLKVTDPKLTADKQDEMESDLKSEKFFSVSGHPSAMFEINDVKTSNGHTTHVVNGDITIKGIKHQMNIPVNLIVSNNKVELKTKFNIIRTHFGIDYMIGEEYGEKKVLPEFEVDVHLVAADLNH
ncbi:MAG: YceI family protein [Bacteroidetes bacterium]|nr:YceI family protein [Bacteroidota bacterium]